MLVSHVVNTQDTSTPPFEAKTHPHPGTLQLFLVDNHSFILRQSERKTFDFLYLFEKCEIAVPECWKRKNTTYSVRCWPKYRNGGVSLNYPLTVYIVFECLQIISYKLFLVCAALLHDFPECFPTASTDC